MKRIIVEKKYNEKKLIKIIQDKYPKVTTGLFYQTLRKKDIKINGKRIKENITIHEKDEIELYIPDEQLIPQTSTKKIYEDKNILIIDKPAEIETTGANSLTEKLTLEYKTTIFPCHRLDRNTTGLIIFAKREDVQQIIQQAFKNKQIEKHYKAQVYGIPNWENQTFEDYLFKDRRQSRVYISPQYKKGYQKIITHCRKIEENATENTCLLEVQIETGKTHQIRAHLAHHGFPIIGDGKYGNNKINKKFHKKYQQLQSYKLQFHLPLQSKLSYLNNLKIEI